LEGRNVPFRFVWRHDWHIEVAGMAGNEERIEEEEPLEIITARNATQIEAQGLPTMDVVRFDPLARGVRYQSQRSRMVAQSRMSGRQIPFVRGVYPSLAGE